MTDALLANSIVKCHDCLNLGLRFFYDGEQYHRRQPVSLPELLDELQKEINSQIDSLRRSGFPKQKIVDLASLIDIMLEKDLDRLDRMLLYRLSSQNGRFDPRLFHWLESLAMAYWVNQLTEGDLCRLLTQRTFTNETENSKSGTEASNSHRTEEELTPASGEPRGDAQIQPNRDSVDELRPIAVFDEELHNFVRIDTEPLRKVQAQVNDFINRICSSRSAGFEVFYVCRVLAHFVDTDFSGMGVLNDLLESANRPASGSYYDVLNVLNCAAYGIECGDYSAEELREALTELWKKRLD
jgi:hypothetical protein